MVSKNKPSEVLAFPMVPQETSFPLFENFGFFNSGMFRNIFEACAIPSILGIWPAVGEISPVELYCSVKFLKWPFSSKLWVAK